MRVSVETQAPENEEEEEEEAEAGLKFHTRIVLFGQEIFVQLTAGKFESVRPNRISLSLSFFLSSLVRPVSLCGFIPVFDSPPSPVWSYGTKTAPLVTSSPTCELFSVRVQKRFSDIDALFIQHFY